MIIVAPFRVHGEPEKRGSGLTVGATAHERRSSAARTNHGPSGHANSVPVRQSRPGVRVVVKRTGAVSGSAQSVINVLAVATPPLLAAAATPPRVVGLGRGVATYAGTPPR